MIVNMVITCVIKVHTQTHIPKQKQLESVSVVLFTNTRAMEAMAKRRRLCPASEEARGDDRKRLEVCYSAVCVNAHATKNDEREEALPETLPDDISCSIVSHLQKHRYETTLKVFLEHDLDIGEVHEQLDETTNWSEKTEILLSWANNPSNGACCDFDDEALVVF